MQFVVIGTDHRMQNSEQGFEGLLRGWLDQHHSEPLQAVAEEYGEKIGESVGQRLARERGLRWFNLDMTTEEKIKAGIQKEQWSRPISTDAIAFRVPSDEVREEAWAEKLSNPQPGTTLVVCGYVHFESLVKTLRAKGYAIDKRVYLETVPEIKFLKN